MWVFPPALDFCSASQRHHCQCPSRSVEGPPPSSKTPLFAGWGRRSKDNVATLRPAVARMLSEELGAPLEFVEPPQNPGMLTVDDERWGRGAGVQKS